MSERFKIAENVNESSATRLPIANEFSHYRFSRDALAHVSRYLLVIERIIEGAEKKGKPISWIDLGCGDIYLPRILSASFRVRKDQIVERYVGVDIDEKNMRRAEATKPKCFPIDLWVGDLTAGALVTAKNNEFNVVTCLEVIEHLKPECVAGLLAEIKRIGHVAYISTPNFGGGSGRIPADHIKEWRHEELLVAMAKAGLRVKEKIGIFSNLMNVEHLAWRSAGLARIYNFLKDRTDKNFLSIIMARFLKESAQNILYICG